MYDIVVTANAADPDAPVTEGVPLPQAGTVLYAATVTTRPGDVTAFLLSNASVATYSKVVLGTAYSLLPETRYNVTARAHNSLGWSGWSRPSCADCDHMCTTAPTEKPPLNPLLFIIPLVAILLCVLIVFFLHWKTNLTKILAPRLRRRQDREVIADFVSSDMTPMEEQDPELIINPIVVHKMKMERERQRRAKNKKGGTGMGRTGGLARLNLRLEEPKAQVDERKIEMNMVDHYLERDKGIVDHHKLKSAYEREQAGKELLRGAKKAANNSSLNEAQGRKEGLTHARADAREAARAAKAVRAVDADDDSGAGPRSAGANGGGGGGIRQDSANTAFL